MNLNETVLRSKLGMRVRLPTWQSHEYVTNMEITEIDPQYKLTHIAAIDETGQSIRMSLYPEHQNNWKLFNDI